ncbi:dihydrofolate reductase family protein [Bremerella sp. T1]|uniref:dihydrofolate reductase family protein n=1 Tax=Bremerella sp. TYQ1 TaxID=3119568 RepID=UPI001CCC7FBE|nr:dihydrofolate reductase family protein [Bremerella volcania]UBM34461.1 dihydrofolate reductase family protein [Bremerella volcania]
MRKIVYFVTASLDGYIARPNGAIDWLIQAEGDEDFGFSEFVRSIDTVVQGRKTYEHVLELGPYPYAEQKNFVFSRKMLQCQHAEVVRQPVADFVRWIHTQPGKDVWLVGGGQLAASFLHVGAIDELKVFIQPILLGEGLPLVTHIGRDTRLKVKNSHTFRQGLVQIDYEVLR